MTALPSPSHRRLVVFRVVTGLVAVLMLLAAPNVLAPWLPINLQPDVLHPEVARWHAAVEGSGDVVGLLLLLLLLRRPAENPLVVVSYAMSVVVATLVVLPFTGPSLLFAIVPVLLVLAAYPYWRQVAGLRRTIRPHPVLLVIAVAAAAALAVPAVVALRHQIAGVGEMAATNQWATYAEHLTTAAIGGFLAASGLPGSRRFAGLGSAGWIYLGVSAIVLRHQPDSWGVPGGLAAIATGAVVAVVAIAARRRSARPARVPLATPA
jgi:hypothetical protein